MKRILLALTILCFFITSVFGTFPVYAQEFSLPTPGVRVALSPQFNPPILKGIKVHPDNPFHFDFILDTGDEVRQSQQEQLKTESTRLIKYFLASLTIPEKDLWVNLSPYEKNRIIPQSFGLTEMGRDLLAEDYMLKQITASLIYPEGEIGKKFWKRIYEEAAKKFGTTNIPVNTFNKVWIIPEKAVVYENANAGTAYIVESKLKVMLEQDYLALEKNAVIASSKVEIATRPSVARNDTSTLASNIVREIVIPELTKEVNEGKNFAQLRQVYNSLILATWYKKKIRDSILAQVYENKNKISGILSSPNALVGDPKQIYQRYLQAFKKGAYNYIKEEVDPTTQQPIPRKYFSGGVLLNLNDGKTDFAQTAFKITSHPPENSDLNDHAMTVEVNTQPVQMNDEAEQIRQIQEIQDAYQIKYSALEDELEFPGLKGVPNFTAAGYFSPTDVKTAVQILAMAGVKKHSVFIDAGGGDGRVAIIASKVFGAEGFSIESDLRLTALADEMAKTLEVSGKVKLISGWIEDHDLSNADVIYYTYNEPYNIEHYDQDYFKLGPESNFKTFERQIARELKPGAVVVLSFGPQDLKFDPRYFEEFVPSQLPLNMTIHPRFFRRLQKEYVEDQAMMGAEGRHLYQGIGNLVGELKKTSVTVRIHGQALDELADNPEKLEEQFSHYSVVKDPEEIEKILQAKLDLVQGKALPSGIDRHDIEVLFDALFNQEEFLARYSEQHPLNVVIFRGGRGASQYTEVLKNLPNVRVQVILGAVDDGRSWYTAARDFKATGVPDMGKSLLDLAEDQAVKKFLAMRLAGEDSQLKENLEALVWAADGISLEKRRQISRYLKKFLEKIQGEYHWSHFSLNDIPMRSVVLLGAVWDLEDQNTPDFWQKAVDEVGVLLDVGAGNRVILPTKERRYLVGMSADGTIFGAETGINEFSEKSSPYIGLWLMDRPFDINEFKGELSSNGIKVEPLRINSLNKKYDPSLKQEIESTTFQVPQKYAYRTARLLEKFSTGVRLNPEAEAILAKADTIVFGNTTFESNIGSSLIIPGMGAAIEDNTHAVKIHIINPTNEADPSGTTALSLLERLYRYATGQFLYTYPVDHWEGVGRIVNYMIGVPTKTPGLEQHKDYLPFDQGEVKRTLGGEVATVPLDLMDISHKWGIYEPDLLREATIALVGIHAAGFKVTSDGELVKETDAAMASAVDLNAKRKELPAFGILRSYLNRRTGAPLRIERLDTPGLTVEGTLKDVFYHDGFPMFEMEGRSLMLVSEISAIYKLDGEESVPLWKDNGRVPYQVIHGAESNPTDGVGPDRAMASAVDLNAKRKESPAFEILRSYFNRRTNAHLRIERLDRPGLTVEGALTDVFYHDGFPMFEIEGQPYMLVSEISAIYKMEGEESVALWKDNGRVPFQVIHGAHSNPTDGTRPDMAQFTKKPTGGIDLTSNKALTVQNGGQGIKFHIDSAMLAQLQNAPGFVPVVISIKPLMNLRRFLGVEGNLPVS